MRIESGSDAEVRAWVRGSRQYSVLLSYAGGELKLRCDCPYFETDGPCKHLWATLLASDAAGHLSKALAAGNYLSVYEDVEPGADDFSMDEPLPLPQFAANPAYSRFGPPRYAPPPPTWRQQLSYIGSDSRPAEPWPADRQLLYILDPSASAVKGGLVVGLLSREPKLKTGWKKSKSPRLSRSEVARLPDPLDRQILSLLSGADEHNSWQPGNIYEPLPSHFRVLYPLTETLLPLLAATGRCQVQGPRSGDWAESAPRLIWDDGDAWNFHLELEPAEKGQWALRGCLRRNDESMDIQKPVLILSGGLVLTTEKAARLAADAPMGWISHFRRAGPITLPAAEVHDAVAALVDHPQPVPVKVPAELGIEPLSATPKVALKIHRASQDTSYNSLIVELYFDYDGWLVLDDGRTRDRYDAPRRRLLRRDTALESAVRLQLAEWAVFRPAYTYSGNDSGWLLPPHTACPGWSRRRTAPAGTSRPTARPSASRASSSFRSPPASTGSSCTARWTMGRPAPACPRCSPRSNAARPWLSSTTAASGFCRRSGWRASPRWPRWARAMPG